MIFVLKVSPLTFPPSPKYKTKVTHTHHANKHSQKKRSTFAENVAQQVIERSLLRDIAEKTFCPQQVPDYPDDVVAALTAESKRITLKREQLEEQKAALGRAKEAFAKHLDNPLKRRARELDEDDDSDSDIMVKRR